ncbi:MAG: hypothetical protein AAGI67_07985 [Pseudomonadota bacterium]
MKLCLLCLLLTGCAGLPAATAAERQPVYRGVAPDGTVLFADRPSSASSRGSSGSGRVWLPPANVMPPTSMMPAADVAEPPTGEEPVSTDVLAAPEERERKTCRQLRTALAALWQERRHGYAADRGPELKARIRDLQTRRKEACGHWR